MFKAVIPARMASSRLPGKPLVDIAGKPMIEHVHQRALESGADEVVVATDDDRVYAACEAFGARAMLTAAEHESGTERVAEVAERDGDPDERIIVNVQGDEPLLPGTLIAQVAANLEAFPEADIATLCEPIETDEDTFDPSVVKVVADARGFALYFSRATIPWYRDEFERDPGRRPGRGRHLRHVGIYAYRVGFLKRYVAAPATEIERAERLEQLRALHMGGRIHVATVSEPPGPGVDTVEDLARVRAMFEGRPDSPAHG